MNRSFSTLLSITLLLALAPLSRAAIPFDPSLAYAFAEKAPGDTHFWCAFPDVANHWYVSFYEKRRHGLNGATYRKLGEVIKVSGPSWRFLCQMMTVRTHTGEECFLVAYRDRLQQPYRGFTKNNPFGWHTFGATPPAEALVVEIPAGTPAKEINQYERTMRKEWTRWPRR
jgi:hypothetical protein